MRGIRTKFVLGGKARNSKQTLPAKYCLCTDIKLCCNQYFFREKVLRSPLVAPLYCELEAKIWLPQTPRLHPMNALNGYIMPVADVDS